MKPTCSRWEEAQDASYPFRFHNVGIFDKVVGSEIAKAQGIMKVSIGRAAKELGVSRDVLRRWEADLKIEVERAPNGRRRYDLEELRKLFPENRMSPGLTLAYARVASSDQKEDLAQQIAMLESYCRINGWQFELLQDIGSGVNYNNQGVRKLVDRVCTGDVRRIVITQKDRLLRLGAELIFSLCERFGTEVVIINPSTEISYEEDELIHDVLDIVKLFSLRLYGNASEKSRQLMDWLLEVAEKLYHYEGDNGKGIDVNIFDRQTHGYEYTNSPSGLRKFRESSSAEN